MLNRLKSLFHRETVFCVSAVLAVLSMFLVPPDGGYLRYPDRNSVAPRLTEMEQDKILKVIGKRDSARSGRRIAVYRRVR